jgi:uncharacterized protein YfdQ (DUF2303 family)
MSMTGTSQHFPTGELIESIKDLAVRAAGVTIEKVNSPVFDGGVPYQVPVAIVHGDQPRVLGLAGEFEPYRQRPARKTGTAKALTLQSLIDLTNRHKTPHSAIFADTDWRKPSITAVVDYHELQDIDFREALGQDAREDEGEEAEPEQETAAELHTEAAERIAGDLSESSLELTVKLSVEAGRADFGKHRINYAFPLSEPWKAWVEQNGKPMEQADFAAFIEDHIAELCAPTAEEKASYEKDFQTTVATPSQLIQLSRGLQVNVNAVVKNVVTLQSGEGQVTFDEQHTDADGKALKVPGIFLLNIAPFFMGSLISIPVRLRYRPSGSKLFWYYQIYRPDEHITARVRADLRKVAEETGLPSYEGTPEMAA